MTNTIEKPGRTNPEDWTVNIQSRKPAPYKTPVVCELITFTFAHCDGESETLADCPFESGISEDGLKMWLANREPNQEKSRPRMRM